MKKHFYLWITVLLAAGLIWINGSALGISDLTNQSGRQPNIDDPPITATLLLPAIMTNHAAPKLEFLEVWTSRADGAYSQVFLPGESIQYWLEVDNTYPYTQTAALRWTQESSCAPVQIVTTTLELTSGHRQENYTATQPDCLGVYTHTVEITAGLHLTTLSTRYVVNPLSSVILENRQAFDRCVLPTVEEMQAWWDHSPYSTFNVYLGGISFFCWENPLDAFWLEAVARQGWTFILTWVGPQAPCSRYRYPMSWDPEIAYQQGRAEADLAVATAQELGFLGDKIIYYDVESYSGATTACRNVTAAFIEGWVQRLHERGTKAGAYGSACSSYMSDWAGNSPPPDDVWIAHWYEDGYSADATVWETPCLGDVPGPPIYWINHQRLKQYAGDHVETWGGIALTIDSDVMDGEITALTETVSVSQTALVQTGFLDRRAQIQSIDLLAPGVGWVLRGEQILWTGDGGHTWETIVSPQSSSAAILDVHFFDRQHAWLVSGRDPNSPGQIRVFHTQDGGQSWQLIPLSILDIDHTGAELAFVDPQTGWLVLEQVSGSSFSRGRLFSTQDGGQTWWEADLPLGAPLHFMDAQTGWMAGGPDGQQAYRTLDGGATWTEIAWDALPLDSSRQHPVPEAAIAVDFADLNYGWVIVQAGSCQGDKRRLDLAGSGDAEPWQCELTTQLWQTRDDGLSWQRIALPAIE